MNLHLEMTLSIKKLRIKKNIFQSSFKRDFHKKSRVVLNTQSPPPSPVMGREGGDGVAISK